MDSHRNFQQPLEINSVICKVELWDICTSSLITKLMLSRPSRASGVWPEAMEYACHQSAYGSFHSTEIAVLAVHNDIARTIDSGKISALVLLDLSAAFDTVDHLVLLQVLQDRLLCL